MNDLDYHLQWLGYARDNTVGLVVTAPALAAAQVVPDKNIAVRQEQLRGLLGEAMQVPDLKAFFVTFLNWQPTDFRAPGEAETVFLQEYKEELKPDEVVVNEGARVALLKQVPNGVDLDALPAESTGWHASEQTRFERLLRDTKVPVGLLSNGHSLRLVYAPSGESSGHLTFNFASLIEVGGRPLLSALVALLHADRLFNVPVAQRLPAVLADSRRFQSEVSTRLSEQVLEALHLLLRGFEAADSAVKGLLLHELRREAHRQELSEGLLTVVLRLVFLLYAEDKGLMPQSTTYLSSYSVTGLFEQLRDDEARFPDVMHQRFGAWPRLLTLFRLAFLGGAHGDFHLPKRNGELFDPDRFPFLEGRPPGTHFSSDRTQKLNNVPRVSDGTVLGVLRNLLILDGERLSYRALDVEQIGSVYESMMGFELMEAAGRAVALRPAHVVVDLDELLELPGKKRLEHLNEEAGVDVSGAAGKAVQAASTFDELVSALERRLSPFTRQPLPKGSLFLQPGKERRRSGSHYTPRSLTEPIVRTTLEPMLRGLGPNPLPREILSLKVCDPAMGSGAFLVETCRYLGEALKEAWARHRLTPKVPPDEDLTLHARRVVAQKCLYGVDKNHMAVQLSKLSLWLFTLAKDHPFTFLDHALKAGDSLVGLTRTQLARFTWEDDTTSFTQIFTTHVEALVERGEALRLQIHDLPDPPDTAELHVLNEQAEASLETARLLGHLVIGEFFRGGSAKAKKEALRKRAAEVQALFTERLGNRSAVRVAPELAVLNAQLRASFEAMREEIAHVPERPFHWELEFPEVFGKGRDGFDSFVGNPPFSGKNGISEAGGDEYIPWLQTVHVGSHGNADLSAHFFRRAFDLLCDHGTFGLISTNTIAQGDTRATGLKHLVTNAGVIFAATRSMMWPGNAAVAVAVVHVAKGKDRESIREKILDEKRVPDINSRLRGKPERPDPQRLSDNTGICFEGVKVYGKGFVLSQQEANDLIRIDASSSQVIFPLISGEDVNDLRPGDEVRRKVIFFARVPRRNGAVLELMTLAEAKGHPAAFTRVEELVKPGRSSAHGAAAQQWWLFERSRPELFSALTTLPICVCLSRVTKHLCFSKLPTDYIFTDQVVLWTIAATSFWAMLQSRAHASWVGLLSSSMKQDFRYATSDCFENYPFPQPDPRSEIPELEQVGERLYTARAEYMKSTNQGLTQTYNKLKDPGCNDADVVALRELHLELDRAVLAAYGWTGIEVPPYTTPETDEEKARLEAFEDEVLDKLFALNAARAALEAPAAAPPPPTKKPKTKRPKKNQTALDLDPD